MLTWIIEKLKSSLLEKWLGRVIVLGLASATGFMVANGIDQQTAATWSEATKELVLEASPLVIAWLLGKWRLGIALNKTPPIK